MFVWKPGKIGSARAARADGKACGGNWFVSTAMSDGSLHAHDFQFFRRDPLASPLGQVEWRQFCACQEDDEAAMAHHGRGAHDVQPGAQPSSNVTVAVFQ